MGVGRDPERDALERYFRASATAILLGSLVCGALAMAVLLDWLDAASTTAVVAFLGAGFGLYFGFLLFRLWRLRSTARPRSFPFRQSTSWSRDRLDGSSPDPADGRTSG